MKWSLLLLFPGLLSARLLTDFSADAPVWSAVNDDVMGGRSQGGAERQEDGRLVFAGRISLENRGGFSSIRSNSPAYALPGDGTLRLRVRGDGRTYYMDLRTGTRQGGFSYRQPFRTRAGEEWEEIRLPLAGFRASAFGQNLPMAPALDPAQVVSLGFTLNDKTAGPFRLELKDIRFEAPAAPPPAPEEDPAVALIELAVARGAPLFNLGQTEACAALYELAAHALLRLPEAALPAAARADLRKALEAAAQQPAPADRAWTLRRALDLIHSQRGIKPSPAPDSKDSACVSGLRPQSPPA